MALSQLNALASPVDEPQLRAIQTALKDMSPTQIAWVSGYLAGLSAVGSPAEPRLEKAPVETISILFGSQTGNAKGVAEQLGEQALAQGLEVRVTSMSDYNPRKLAKERWVLILVSTHGEGEPPESAFALHTFVQGQRAPRLERLRYAVLGLGDSSYEHFCQTAVDFDRRLSELGAQRFMPLQCCDIDYQTDANAWSGSVLMQLAELGCCEPTAKRTANVVALPGAKLTQARPHGKEHPYRTSLLENRRITTEDAIADVRHLVLAADPQLLRYRPGDALGVWFQNDPVLADAVLAEANLDGETQVHLEGEELGLRQALIERLELTQLHPATVSGWSELTGTAELKALVSDPARLRAFAGERQFVDLLLAHPAQLDAPTLVGLLRPLQPRLYSIASSQSELEDEVHLTVSVLRYQIDGRDRLGGASGFLTARLGLDDPLEVYVAENPSFRLPEDGDTPIIMIGAGTGVAPYRAFLQERAAKGDRGANWLVFGNRHFHRDFLYQLDWQAQRKAGLLQRVSLAFSRDGADRIYVQQSLREQGRELFEWLEEGAHLYVCGGTAMGRAVHEALLEVIGTQGDLGQDAAAEYVDNLRLAARYHRDLY